MLTGRWDAGHRAGAHCGATHSSWRRRPVADTAFVGIYRETLMAAHVPRGSYGFRKRSISRSASPATQKPAPATLYCGVHHVLRFIIHYKTFHLRLRASKVAGGFLLGLPTLAAYFGQEFFPAHRPMWYLLALLMGWILLRRYLNIFPGGTFPGGGRCHPAELGYLPALYGNCPSA